VLALAEDVAELRELVQAYRALALQALTVVHDLTEERERLRARFVRLCDEYRDFREQVMREAEPAA
jgi:hypothetical protein